MRDYRHRKLIVVLIEDANSDFRCFIKIKNRNWD